MSIHLPVHLYPFRLQWALFADGWTDSRTGRRADGRAGRRTGERRVDGRTVGRTGRTKKRTEQLSLRTDSDGIRCETQLRMFSFPPGELCEAGSKEQEARRREQGTGGREQGVARKLATKISMSGHELWPRKLARKLARKPDFWPG